MLKSVSCYLNGVGLLAPGLADWPTGANLLANLGHYQSAPCIEPQTQLLSSRERRRSTRTIRLAFSVAEQACQWAQVDTAQVPTVFTSYAGDQDILQADCLALAAPDRLISPTKFHNSVHNAVAGNWTIGVQCRQPYTSISGGWDSFNVGLFEAACQLANNQPEILLVAYDALSTDPIQSATRITADFACALLISQFAHSQSLARLTISLLPEISQDSPCGHQDLTQLCRQNPMARSLPLLTAVAQITLNQGKTQQINLAASNGVALQISVEPLC